MSARRFQGKVCVVTASTQGIGFAIAERFALEGGRVVVSSRKADAVKAAVDKIRALPGVVAADITGVPCHVGDAENRGRLLKHVSETFGTIDVLILNAAASTHYGPTMKTSEAAYDKMMELNVKSYFMLTKEAQPYFTPSKFTPGGFTTNVLLVSSVGGYLGGNPIGIYSLTKTTLIGLTRVLAEDLATKGIRVNSVAPGVIRTAMAKVLVAQIEKGTTDEPLMRNCYMKRVGESAEMAAVAAFLCSADASYITGETIVAAGGPARL